MLEKILNLEGVTVLEKKEKLSVKAGSCMDDAWDYGTTHGHMFEDGAYAATDAYYISNCI